MADVDLILAAFNDLKELVLQNRNITPVVSAEIIDTKELCKRLDVSEPTIIRWRRQKKVPFIKIDGVIRYNWPEVVKSLESKSYGKK